MSMSKEPKLGEGIERGRVKWFTTKNGGNYGFIIRVGKPDLHFHHDKGTSWRRVNDEFFISV